MNINNMLYADSFLVNFNGTSKKQVLDELCKLAEKKLKISSRTLLENLTKREKLRSTAVGNGIAIPHANVPNIEKCFVFVSTLVKGLDFNSTDDQLVDIVFLSLSWSTMIFFSLFKLLFFISLFIEFSPIELGLASNLGILSS